VLALLANYERCKNGWLFVFLFVRFCDLLLLFFFLVCIRCCTWTMAPKHPAKPFGKPGKRPASNPFSKGDAKPFKPRAPSKPLQAAQHASTSSIQATAQLLIPADFPRGKPASAETSKPKTDEQQDDNDLFKVDITIAELAD
jgi:hypothetical protein